MVNSFYPLIALVVLALGLGIVGVTSRLHLFSHIIQADDLLAQKCQKQRLFLTSVKVQLWVLLILLISTSLAAYLYQRFSLESEISAQRARLMPIFDKEKVWEAPDAFLAKTDQEADLIRYGRDLIANTQDYFGENGLVRPMSINRLNCQNCHLEAGTKPFGNNYFGVQSIYPKIRARSGQLETIPKRINDCIQRSLNGAALDTTSLEMRAIASYIRWLGTSVPKGEKPQGVGLVSLPMLGRPANPIQGEKTYVEKCASCHSVDGQGLPIPDSPRDYPPLWGPESYNQAAGLFRLSRFASYIKANMPFGANYLNPQLSDEEAWDIAAYINMQDRPLHPFLDTDWPDISKKPFDHPFGPFSDTFPENQHKFGPFAPIIAFQKAQKE